MRSLLCAGVVCVVVVLGLASEVCAQRITFDRPSAAAFAGIGTRNLTGKIGELTSTGVEFYYGQSIQYRYFGFRASVGTSYFLTKQIPPPITRGVQFYSLRFSPMLIFPIYMFQLQIDPLEYERVGMISNTLVRTTGNDQSFNAFGGGATLLWEPSPFLMLGVRTSYNQFVDVSKALSFDGSATDLGGIFSLTFQIAVLGSI